MVQPGDVYRIPLVSGHHAVVTILGLGHPPWNPSWSVMLAGIHERAILQDAPINWPVTVIERYWCDCAFVADGKWSLVERGTVPEQKGSLADSVWATYELWLDDVRQSLGFERQTYKGAEFTFSTICNACGAALAEGFARCRKCRTIREEFRGLERFVAEQPGRCCLSGALCDVQEPNGDYYWAPYFIGRVRAGEVTPASAD
jgi:hypothetical protein